jgi:hypothetical protein
MRCPEVMIEQRRPVCNNPGGALSLPCQRGIAGALGLARPCDIYHLLPTIFVIIVIEKRHTPPILKRVQYMNGPAVPVLSFNQPPNHQGISPAQVGDFSGTLFPAVTFRSCVIRRQDEKDK